MDKEKKCGKKVIGIAMAVVMLASILATFTPVLVAQPPIPLGDKGIYYLAPRDSGAQQYNSVTIDVWVNSSLADLKSGQVTIETSNKLCGNITGCWCNDTQWTQAHTCGIIGEGKMVRLTYAGAGGLGVQNPPGNYPIGTITVHGNSSTFCAADLNITPGRPNTYIVDDYLGGGTGTHDIGGENGTFTCEVPVATTGDININEIMYNPAGEESWYEWIELHNNDTKEIDVSGWVLNGTIGGSDTILSGTVGMDGYLTIAKNVSAFQERYPAATCPIIKGNWSNLANGGDWVNLSNATSANIHTVNYPGGFSDNYSAELNATGGWEESLVDGGTPCQRNSVLAGPPSIISYAPETPVYDDEGATRTFNITVNQTVNVTWLLNGTQVGSNESVTEASYTNTSAVIGTWNVSAIVENVNGEDMQTWDWVVTAPVPTVGMYHLVPKDSSVTGYCNSKTIEVLVNSSLADLKSGKVTIETSNKLCGNITGGWCNDTQWTQTHSGVIDGEGKKVSLTYAGPGGNGVQNPPGNYTIGTITVHCNSSTFCAADLNIIPGIPNTYIADDYLGGGTGMHGIGGENGTFTCEIPAAGAPNITSYAPETPVYDDEGATRTFNITVNQTVNVTWLINGTQVGSNEGVTEASYTNTSAVIGTWNVSAIVENDNGEDMQTWWWNVTAAPRYDVELTVKSPRLIPVPPSENATFTLIVKNTGTVNDTFNLTTTVDDPANVTATLGANVTPELVPDGTHEVSLNVSSTIIGKYIVNVTATSQGDPNVNATASTTTNVTLVPHRAVTLVYNPNNIGYSYIAWTGNYTITANELVSMMRDGVGPEVFPGDAFIAYYNTTSGEWEALFGHGGGTNFALRQYEVVCVRVAAEGTFFMPV